MLSFQAINKFSTLEQ